MSNLIITVIAIGLAGLLALAGVYYGGSYINSMHASADAATFLNIGNQVAEAWRAYKEDHAGNPPTVWSQLVGGYLTSYPSMPTMAGGVAVESVPLIGMFYSNNSVWLWAEVGRSTGANPDPAAFACLKIIKLATGTAPAMPAVADYSYQTFTSLTNGNGTFGCTQWDGGSADYGGYLQGSVGETTPGDYMAFYKLQAATPQ